MKAIQKIIFFLSMAVVLMLCQEVFAVEDTPDFVKGAKKLDAANDKDFNDKLQAYKDKETKMDGERGKKESAAKAIVNETQSWVMYAIDFVDFRDNAFNKAQQEGLSLLEAEVLAARITAQTIKGKCVLAAIGDDKKNEKCKEVSRILEEYVKATQEWRDAKSGRQDFENMMTSDKDIYYAMYCSTDAEGKEKCVRVYFKQECDEKTGKCTYTQTAGVATGCTPLPIKLSETKTCIFCPLFKVIFDAANTMATTSYATLGRPMALIMLIGLAIYIAFKVTILTSGFVKQDAPKFISETLTQAFKILVAYILLYNANQIYIYAISPVLGAGLEFGTAIMGGEYSKYLKGCATASMGISSGVLPAALYARLDCFIRAVQEEIAIPQSVGSSLVCVAARRGASIQYVLPNFSMLFVGVIIWGFSWLVMLAFGFYLIDATIRIGIVGALMPFLIATWPFKATSKYASTGWGMILNTFFVYVFLGIVIAVNVTLMFVSIGGADGERELKGLINDDSVLALSEKLDIGLSGFLVLIIGCLFGFKLTSQSSALAGSFAGGAGPDIAPKIGGLMASGATGAGKWLGGKTLQGGKRVIESSGVGGKIRHARDWVKSNASKAVSGIFGGGDPSKSPKKPATPKTGGGAAGFTSGNQNAQPNTTAQQQGGGSTGGSTGGNTGGGNTGAPTPNNSPQDGGNTSPANVENAVNAGPRGSEQTQNAESQKNDPVAQAHMDGYKTYLQMYKDDKDRSAKDSQVAQRSDKALNDFKNDPNLTDQAKRNALPQFEGLNSLNQHQAETSQKSMQNSAVRAYTQKKQAEAVSQGKAFNEQETKDYATENFDAVLKELDNDISKEE